MPILQGASPVGQTLCLATAHLRSLMQQQQQCKPCRSKRLGHMLADTGSSISPAKQAEFQGRRDVVDLFLAQQASS